MVRLKIKFVNLWNDFRLIDFIFVGDVEVIRERKKNFVMMDWKKKLCLMGINVVLVRKIYY